MALKAVTPDPIAEAIASVECWLNLATGNPTWGDERARQLGIAGGVWCGLAAAQSYLDHLMDHDPAHGCQAAGFRGPHHREG